MELQDAELLLAVPGAPRKFCLLPQFLLNHVGTLPPSITLFRSSSYQQETLDIARKALANRKAAWVLGSGFQMASYQNTFNWKGLVQALQLHAKDNSDHSKFSYQFLCQEHDRLLELGKYDDAADLLHCSLGEKWAKFFEHNFGPLKTPLKPDPLLFKIIAETRLPVVTTNYYEHHENLKVFVILK